MQYNAQNAQKPYDHYTVDRDTTLLEYLLATLHESRSKIKATLHGNGIKVNGKVITAFNYPLSSGMKISVSRSKQNNLFKNKYIQIIYEDRWLVVIEKNAGILSMAGGHSSLNVKAVLDDYFRKSHQHCTAHVVHRLDRDTSGLMIYAKDLNTEQILEHNWHDIVYDRRYVAVVSGEIVEDGGTISSWLKDNNAFFTYSSKVDNGGKFAVTHFNVLARTVNHSLVEFALETGRKNQIRVHASDVGHPICGDSKYGNGDDPIGRLCLHAYVLCFSHPMTGKRMEFSTKIPLSFRKLFS